MNPTPHLKTPESNLPSSWAPLLPELEKKTMKDLKTFLVRELEAGKTIFPHASLFFQALHLTPLEKVKVVIVGQDPYHDDGQAHGLAFSVKRPVPPPPSLKNIFKELKRDLDIPFPAHGDLSSWASQGVLLLNTCLSVEKANPASHRGKGWESFTDAILALVQSHCEHVVFLLWGRHAQSKEKIVDPNKHVVLKAGHPSPLSVRFFQGCGHFSKTNEILKKWQYAPIDWALD